MATADAAPAVAAPALPGSPAAVARLAPAPAAPRPARRWRLHRFRRGPAPPPVAPEAAPFQDELEALLQEPPPRLLRRLPWILAALVISLVAAAAIAEIEIVVTGPGRLAPDAPPLVLQPMERAVIREIRVRPGDRVVQGQVLAVLDPSFAEADRAALAAQRRMLSAHLDRLLAEVAGRPVPPPEGVDLDTLLQAGLHARRQAFVAARLAAMDGEIQGIEAAILSLQEADSSLAEQVGVSRDVEAMRTRLMEGQLGSRLNLLAARSQRLQAEREREQGRGRMQELRHALASKRADRQGFLEEWRRQLLEETVRIHAERAKVEEALAKAIRLAALTVMTAPADGTVLDIARRSAGSVLREAEPLVTLVPAGAPLIAEVVLRSADIGYARPGDPVVLKIDAFPFQRHGVLRGTLRAIAQEVQTPEAAGLPVHRAQVALAPAPLTALLPGTGPSPGMTLQAEVKVGTRSLLSYLIHPLLRGLSEGMREP